jgi:hypothetical protein
VIGGCSGCLLLLIILVAVGAYLGKGFVDQLSKEAGPTTAATVAESLGEIPMYPGGTIELNATKALRLVFLGIERASGKKSGTIVRGIAFINTPQDEQRVLDYYQEQLTKLGWKRQETSGAARGGAAQQRAYRKGNELVIVQVQPRRDEAGSGTTVLLMRGGPEMTQYDATTGARRQPGN